MEYDPLKVRTQWKIKHQIRSETALDKAEEKIGKLECRSHETFQNTRRKDRMSDYIKSRLKHMEDRMKKSHIYYSREQNLKFLR